MAQDSFTTVKYILIAALVIALVVTSQVILQSFSATTYKGSDIDILQKSRAARVEVLESRSKRNEKKINLMVEALQAKNANNQSRYEYFINEVAKIQAQEQFEIPAEAQKEAEAKKNEELLHK